MPQNTSGSTDLRPAVEWGSGVEKALSDNLIALSVIEQWDRALMFFDEGDVEKLADLLRSDLVLPMEHRIVLAEIIVGERRPQRGKGRLKLDFDKRNRIALEVRRFYLNWGKLIAREKKPSDYGLTPAEAGRLRAQWRRDAIETLSAELGLSESAVSAYWKTHWAIYREQLNRRSTSNRKWTSRIHRIGQVKRQKN